MKLPEPRLWLVSDPEDTPASTRALHALADLDGGVVVVRVTPGSSVLHTMAKDLLTALGKDHGRPGGVRCAEENWRRCAAWLSAERVRHLIVDRAETLSPNRWQDFIGLAAHCGASLWLVAHGGSLTRGQREMLDDWPLTEMTFDQFIAEQAAHAPTDPGRPGAPIACGSPAPDFPVLPRSDFTTFRADCRLLLAPDAFQSVEVEMRHAADMTRRWLAAAAEPDAAAMKEHLRELIKDCRSTDQALARLRAAQAACLMGGLLVTVDLERLAGSTETARPLIDRHLVDQLRAFTSPHHAAVALVACVTGASPAALSRLNMSDATGLAVTVDGRSCRVPEIAQSLLAAHLHQRLAAGAVADDALFSDAHRGELGERRTYRVLRRVINLVATATGLMLWGEFYNEDDVSQKHWLRRRGVSVQALR